MKYFWNVQGKVFEMIKMASPKHVEERFKNLAVSFQELLLDNLSHPFQYYFLKNFHKIFNFVISKNIPAMFLKTSWNISD